MTVIESEFEMHPTASLDAPVPSLPDGRGPDADIIPVATIAPGRDLILKISTTTWPNPNDADTFVVQASRTLPPPNPENTDFLYRSRRFELGPLVDRPAERDFIVPADLLGEDLTPDGPTPLWVRCVMYRKNQNALSSPVIRVFIDRTAPFQAKPTRGGAIPGTVPGVKGIPVSTSPNSQPGVTIDNTWMALPNSVDGLIQMPDIGYANRQDTDRLTLYAASNRTDPPAVAPIHDGPLPANGRVLVPLDVIRAATSTGRLHMWMRWTDVAGNFSNYLAEYRNVSLQPLPVLAAPIVLLAATPVDNLIDLNDVRQPQGIQVRVNRPTNALSTDTISLSWGGQAAEDLDFLGASSLLFTIPWSKLTAEYTANQSGTDWVVPTTVTAHLMRGGASVSNALVTVDTDYSVPGVPYPIDLINPPADVNAELKPLIVRGQAPVTDNVLGPQDINQDAIIFIDLTPVSPGTWPDPEPNDQVTVYYRGAAGVVVVNSKVLDVSDVNTTIDLELPWHIVDNGGLGTRQMWWEVENANRNNKQKAGETNITVDTVVLDLPAPVLVRDPNDDRGDDLIVCETLFKLARRAARFHIPASVDLPINTEVTFQWRGYQGPGHTLPSPANTEFIEIRRVTAAEVSTGMTFDVGPYDPVVRNVPPVPPANPPADEEYTGYLDVWYSVAGGSSLHADYRINLVNGAYLYCETEAGWMPVAP
ncbi:hypothetical protein [Pseudomonas prosekii]|uniref:Uncharacterized protein n=1 Tax=Pseudomonas prosekii TaxID=1148509 RepID=A0A1H2BY77_9PSED|nr:hypothetical protein [Pseudomonas prosekii]SDT63255.1 hypothetical protein SAMN05216222_5614 [Pseudomonas prosekii]